MLFCTRSLSFSLSLALFCRDASAAGFVLKVNAHFSRPSTDEPHNRAIIADIDTKSDRRGSVFLKKKRM